MNVFPFYFGNINIIISIIIDNIIIIVASISICVGISIGYLKTFSTKAGDNFLLWYIF